MYLILSSSEYLSNLLIKSEILNSLPLFLNEYAFTFWPKRVISFAPFFISVSASLIILSNGLEYSGPLVYGTTQKWQNLSHPS